MNNNQKHTKATNQFIELANKLKDEGYPVQVISAAMMSASGIYTNYIYAGNEGYLQDSGIDKVCRAYRKRIEEVQQFKKYHAENASKAEDKTK